MPQGFRLVRRALAVMAMLAGGVGATAAGAAQTADLQKQIEDLKEEIRYIKNNYERTEPVEVVKQVTEYVSPSGEIFREPQAGGVSPSDGSKLEERVTYRMMKFSRREAVGEKIDAAVSSAIDGHVIVGLEFVGSYFNTVGAGDVVDNTGKTHSANRGWGEGSLDMTFTGKPMRNTLLFVDLNTPTGTPQVREAWISVQGPKKVLSLQAGVIDLTGTFDSNSVANDETTQFLSPDFVNSPLLGNPANGPGAILRVDFTRANFMVGAQNTLGSAVDFTDNLYFIAEAGLRFNLGGDSHWRVWARQQPRGSQQPDQAIGVSADHRFTQKFSAFGRYAKNSYVEAYDAATDTRYAINTHDWSASGGFELTNYNPRNLKERIGAAYGRTVLQDGSSADTFELYNRIPLTGNFAFGLHYQAMFSRLAAGGSTTLPNSHTVGLRVQSNY